MVVQVEAVSQGCLRIRARNLFSMQNFVDAQGRFEFPEKLFPEVRGARTVPPSIGSRRAAIVRSAAVAASFLQQASHASDGSAISPARSSQARDWARSVLDFHHFWAPLSVDMVEQALKVLKLLASSYADGEAAYVLGALPTARKAANTNSSEASSSSGFLRSGVSASTESYITSDERRSYLRQALKAGQNRAWYRVGVNSEARGEAESALSRFSRGADRSDSACLYTLGLAYLQGQMGFSRDTERGVNLIELALNGADADFPRAPYFLGKLMLGEGGNVPNGLGLKNLEEFVPINKVRGLDLVERSAFLGFAPALLRMAEAYLGSERGFDCAIALRYLSLAACQECYKRYNSRSSILGGAAEAQIVKWLLCGYENVVEKNELWAFRFAEVSAIDQNASALFALAYFYEVGIATQPDEAKSMALYTLSSERGFKAATARLEQRSTGKPQLRRTLTRIDHDAKMKKHYAALMRGDLGAPSAAITDESTLIASEETTFASEPLPLELSAPQPSNLHESSHNRTQSAVTLSLPYPTSPTHRSQASGPPLPYPEDSPVTSPWQSPTSSPISPRSSSQSLPYPRSPSPRTRARMGQKITQLVDFKSLSPHIGSPTRPSIGPVTGPTTRPNSKSPIIPLGTSGPVMSPISQMGQFGRSSTGGPVVPSYGPPPVPSPTLSGSGSPVLSRNSGSSKYGPIVRPVPSLHRSLQQDPPLHLNHSAESFTSSTDTLDVSSFPQPSSMPSTRPSSRLASLSSSQPDSPGLEAAYSELKPPSRSPSEASKARSESPGRRSISAQWMRQSISGANRFLSSSQASLSAPSTRQESPAPSDIVSDGQSIKKRSQSPLRRIFGSTPEQRAAVSRADRRSFTDVHFAELSNIPKVPIQPIKEERQPGVAYTFEEMGVKPVTSDKSDRCLIQ